MERQRLRRELRSALLRATALATLDELTGIANRRAFESRLAAQWELAARNRTCLAVLLIDIDHFKSFNDALGHQAGDECLRAVARGLAAKVSRPRLCTWPNIRDAILSVAPRWPLSARRGCLACADFKSG
jgi:PleD family two-component response regulator